MSQNHPFVDGNKRTAMVCAIVILRLNGMEFTASDQETKEFVGGLYESAEMNFDNLDAWLREYTQTV